MTDAEKIRALVGYRLEQADEALAAARLNLSNGLQRSAVNRAYYAMFYAVLALLAARQSETSKHSGAISLFDQLYVKTALLPKDFSRWLHDAFLNRQAADYGSELVLSPGRHRRPRGACARFPGRCAAVPCRTRFARNVSIRLLF